MSTTYYSPLRYDFHPDSLAHFRVWLKERYVTLDALNKEWDTEFATWDAVMPMTALEVKERADHAPWADHRQFMEVSFARFFDWTRDGSASATRAHASACPAARRRSLRRLRLVAGHQSFDFIQNYTHCNTSIMQRSFGRTFRALRGTLWLAQPGVARVSLALPS